MIEIPNPNSRIPSPNARGASARTASGNAVIARFAIRRNRLMLVGAKATTVVGAERPSVSVRKTTLRVGAELTSFVSDRSDFRTDDRS